jgi:4-amino-4-deoxychorismate lyase
MIKIPELNPRIVYRCRFLYSTVPEKIEFIPYTIRKIRKLFAIDCGSLDYSFKFSDRQIFETLRSKISDPETEDILLIKNGFITDASFANIVLTDGSNWYTPSTPLLKGTKRQYYLENGIIHEREIKWSDLRQYRSARLINAMVDLKESNDIQVEQIAFARP